jgi:hypothetical protein
MSQTEKKRLGKGLEHISNMFLSTGEEKEEGKLPGGFSSVKIREDSCTSCVYVVEDSHEIPRCRIFTFESEKHGVPHLDTVTPSHAHYCQYFEPITSITSKDSEEIVENKGACSDQAEDMCEVEETVRVQKKMAYPDTENAQQGMRKALSRHLEEGYNIRSISLRKSYEVSAPNRRVSKEEDITIFVKSP